MHSIRVLQRSSRTLITGTHQSVQAGLTLGRMAVVPGRRIAVDAFLSQSQSQSRGRFFSTAGRQHQEHGQFDHHMSRRLRGKNVLITGASSGIGEACARHFAQAGSNLLLAARREDRLESLKKDLEAKYVGVQVKTFVLDVRVRAKVQETAKGFGDVDVLVNNAGLVIGLEKLEDISEEAMDTMIDTNVKGLVHVTQAVLPGMRARNKGHVINIGSVAGQQAYGNGSVYCGSKAAVASISKALLFETIDTDIRVSEINPGMVETEFSVVRFRGDKDKADSVYKGIEPLNGNDIAETVVFVAGRPDHVNIAEMLVFPTNQAAATTVYRKP